MTNISLGGIFLKSNNSHEPKGNPRMHVRITPENSMDSKEIPVSVPRSFLSPADIKIKEMDGYTVIFVVQRTISPSAQVDGKPLIPLKPLRDTTGKYLVIVCR